MTAGRKMTLAKMWKTKTLGKGSGKASGRGKGKKRTLQTCEQHTAPRVFNTCDTRIFVVCTWLKMTELCCVLSFLRVIPSHPCFVALCLTHFLPHHSLRRFLNAVFSTLFLTLAPSPTTSLSLLYLFASPLPVCKDGYALGDWLNKPLFRNMYVMWKGRTQES